MIIGGRPNGPGRGDPNGYAPLDATSKVPNSNLPAITAAMVAADVATQSELDAVAASRLATSTRAAVNGVASLDGAGKIPAAQIPSITASMVAADVATQAELDTVAGLKLDVAQRGANNGVASLDSTGKIPPAQIPSGSASSVAGSAASKVIQMGTLAAPSSGNVVVSFIDATTGAQLTDLYVVVFMGAAGSLTYSNMAATGASAITWEVHQVGGTYAINFKKSGGSALVGALTEGGAGLSVTPISGAIDVITIWTPDGTSMRGSSILNLS